MSTPIIIRVPGIPKTAGSKKAFPIFRGKGPAKTWVRNIVTDDTGQAGKEWRASVQARAFDAMADIGNTPLDCALAVWLTFTLPRPKGHMGAKGLRPSAPEYPTVKPDVLKLARSVEDALTGIVWRDDALIVRETLWKVYGAQPGVEIRVEEAT